MRDGSRGRRRHPIGPEYAALLIALVIYTASHIAEIVRGSIQAVPKGQTEAPTRIALTSSSACGTSSCRRRSASWSRRWPTST
jgi:ABC-type amino acid transport system permease subunit